MSRRSLAAVALLSGCTLANPIDVCDRERDGQVEINRSRVDGDQRITAKRAIAAMPTGGALMVFRSDASASPDENRTEIVGARLDSDGHPSATCGADREYEYVAADGAPSDVQLRSSAALAAPLDTGDAAYGLLAWIEDRHDTLSVRAMGLAVDGCPLGVVGDEPPNVFDVATVSPGCALIRDPSADSVCAVSTSIARLGPQRFVITWEQAASLAGRETSDLYARIVDVDFLSLSARATVLSPDGAAVALISGGRPVSSATLSLGDGRFLLVWQSWAAGRLATLAQIFDDVLAPAGAIRILHDAPATELPVGGVHLDLARNGDRILLVFTERDDAQLTRVQGLFLSTDAETLDGPRGQDPFRIADVDDGEESMPAATPFDDGFLVSWVVEDSAVYGDGSGSSLRAALLSTRGSIRFANPACGQESFTLNLGFSGDQHWPSLTTLAEGGVLAVFTDEGANGADLSGSSVDGIVLHRRALLPVE